MNKLEEQLLKILEQSISLAEKTGDFVIEIAPELLQEFYNWHITKNCFWLFIMSLLSFIVIKIAIITNKKYPEDDGFVAITSFILLTILCTVIVNKIYNIIYILTAPKLYLIEHFSNLY